MTGYWNVIKSMKGLLVGGQFSIALVWSILFLYYVTLISAEQFHLHRDPSLETANILTVDKNRVTTYDQCKVRINITILIFMSNDDVFSQPT